jgi:hypothetical protein
MTINGGTSSSGITPESSKMARCPAAPIQAWAFLREEVSFEKGDGPLAGAHVPFVMTWRVELRDGRQLTMGGNLFRPSGGRWLRGFGVTLNE